MAGLRDVQIVISGKDNFSKVFAQAEQKVNEIGKQKRPYLEELGHKIYKVGRDVSSIGAFGMRTVTMPFIAGTAAVARFGVKYADQLNKVKVFGQYSKESMDTLNKGFIEISRVAPLGPTALAEGSVELAKAGFNATQNLKALRAAALASVAADYPLADMTEGLMTASRQFRMDDFQYLANVFAATANAAQTSMGDLFEAAKLGGTLANSLGISAPEFASFTAALNNMGIKSTEAGTQIKIMLQNIANPLGQGKDILDQAKAIGIATEDVAGNLRKPWDIITDMQAKMDELGMPTAQRTKIWFGTFGSYGAPGAMSTAQTMATSGGKFVEQFSKNLEAASKANLILSQSMERLEGPAGSYKKMMVSIERASISIARSGMLDRLAGKFDMIADGLNYISKMSPLVVDGIWEIGFAGAMSFPALFMLGKTIESTGWIIKKTYSAINECFKSAKWIMLSASLPSGPVLLGIAAGITAIGVALASLTKHEQEEYGETFIGKAFDGIQSNLERTIGLADVAITKLDEVLYGKKKPTTTSTQADKNAAAMAHWEGLAGLPARVVHRMYSMSMPGLAGQAVKILDPDLYYGSSLLSGDAGKGYREQQYVDRMRALDSLTAARDTARIWTLDMENKLNALQKEREATKGSWVAKLIIEGAPKGSRMQLIENDTNMVMEPFFDFGAGARSATLGNILGY